MNKQPNSKDSILDSAALLAINGGASIPGSAQDRLAALLELELGEKRAEKEEARRLSEVARQATLEGIKLEQEKKVALQDACPHMKPNYTPAVGGQKDHKGNYHFVCQYCNKEFGNNLPYHLQIPAERVGGPQ